MCVYNPLESRACIVVRPPCFLMKVEYVYKYSRTTTAAWFWTHFTGNQVKVAGTMLLPRAALSLGLHIDFLDEK